MVTPPPTTCLKPHGLTRFRVTNDGTALGRVVDSVDLAPARFAALIAPVIERLTFAVVRAALARSGDVPARLGTTTDALRMFAQLRTALACGV
jgi:hypothetical protein